MSNGRKNKIVRVFVDTPMYCQHDGLSAIAAKAKVNLEKLPDGEHVIFINRARDKIKVFSSRGLLSYRRRKEGINIGVIEEIPNSFNEHGEIDWVAAERRALEKDLEKVRKRAHARNGLAEAGMLARTMAGK